MVDVYLRIRHQSNVPHPSKFIYYNSRLASNIKFQPQGDYIEHSMGMFMCISTMAAAGFGNTISDVLGLGLAHYVERFCEFLGLRPPKLTQEQMELRASRRVASYVSFVLLFSVFGPLNDSETENVITGTCTWYYGWMLVGYVSVVVYKQKQNGRQSR